MKSKFTSAPDHVMDKAAKQISDATDAGAPATRGHETKEQTKGAAGKLSESIPQLPIIGQKVLDPSRVRIRAGFDRDPAEYADKEFVELRDAIKDAGGNIAPIDVRLLNGVPGFDAELLAGTRRLMACRELKLDVLAVVRDCDDRMADRIHESENKHRKNKSPYSRGLQYQAMFQSGRYPTYTDMAASIQTRLPEISESIALLEKAPAGMWAKVTNPGALKTTQTRQLMAAYGNKAFASAVDAATTLTVDELVALAVKSMRPAPAPSRQTDETRLAPRGKDFIVKLPSGISKELATGAMEAAKAYLKTARK